ncbi:hypothetical protein, partial [Vibrio parahaemolyticus]|uniref:hypothetical protein n=2 Tax=Vibrionaceae TaxID=641 RepID=UPI00387ACB3B
SHCPILQEALTKKRVNTFMPQNKSSRASQMSDQRTVKNVQLIPFLYPKSTNFPHIQVNEQFAHFCP